jgi:two-component system, NarL family, response regulator LiaR
MIKVLVCDDQEIVCEGLRKILDSDPEIEVMAAAHNGMEALDLITRQKPDLVLMDLKMAGMNGIQATRKIREKYPDIPVLVLTTYEDDEWLFDAIRSGAAGYLLKDTPGEELQKAVKGTVQGESYIDPAVARKILLNINQPSPLAPIPTTIDLSEREKEVLQLLTRGYSNADIAEQLFLSEGTVRNYTSAIFAKLGVADRTQAVLAALRYGLVDFKDL